jgi:hypothetical protein
MPAFDVRSRNSVRIQPVGNEGLGLASDATAWRRCVAGTSRLGVRVLVTTSRGNGRVSRLRKFVIINERGQWLN